MKQNQPGVLAGGYLAGKCCARAGGLSKCSGMQHELLLVVASHREMSLGSYGHDREVYRAQHLFCHGAKEQLAYLAPAPGAEEDAICVELANRGRDLLRRVSFANQRITVNVLSACHHSPRFKRLCRKSNGPSRIVI